jgi:hypothetical protein
MNLKRLERADLLMALLFAIDGEEAFIDAHSKTRLRNGNLVSFIKREDRLTVDAAKRRVERWNRLYDKLTAKPRRPARSASDKGGKHG